MGILDKKAEKPAQNVSYLSPVKKIKSGFNLSINKENFFFEIYC